MRKLLTLLLISLLSLQASWAVAAGYCRHEQGAAAKHFGHHEHRHDDAAASATADLSAAGIKQHDSAAQGSADSAGASLESAGDRDIVPLSGVDLDLDCSVCQAHALAGMPSAASSASFADAPRTGVLLLQSRLTSISLPRPERPNWHAA